MNGNHKQTKDLNNVTRTIPCANWQVDPRQEVAIRKEPEGKRMGLLTILIVPQRGGIAPAKKSRLEVNDIREPAYLWKETLC